MPKSALATPGYAMVYHEVIGCINQLCTVCERVCLCMQGYLSVYSCICAFRLISICVLLCRILCFFLLCVFFFVSLCVCVCTLFYGSAITLVVLSKQFLPKLHRRIDKLSWPQSPQPCVSDSIINHLSTKQLCAIY